jgi:hypothetical protein
MGQLEKERKRLHTVANSTPTLADYTTLPCLSEGLHNDLCHAFWIFNRLLQQSSSQEKKHLPSDSIAWYPYRTRIYTAASSS